MRRRTLFNSENGIDPSKSNVGDICFYNRSNGRVIIVDGREWSIQKYPYSRYEPIGIVVVPGIHDVYGDGSCGVMSLKSMDLNNPDEGSNTEKLASWGGEGYDTPLPNLNEVCFVGIAMDEIVHEELQGIIDDASLPSTKFFGDYDSVHNPYDQGTAYDIINNYTYFAPSPYKNDGSRNPLYYQTTFPSSEKNGLSDFDGFGNTKILCDMAIGQADWKTSETIYDKADANYYPAACCCWRFHTHGTKQGQWYLPACGEMGYVVVRINKINDTISQLITSYGDTIGLVVDDYERYMTSTEHSETGEVVIFMSQGVVQGFAKHLDFYIRSFLRVG